MERRIIGLDFGTDSVRAVVLNADKGTEEASEVALYPRWADGKYCSPAENRFRQHPRDYIEAMEAAVRGRPGPPGTKGRRERRGDRHRHHRLHPVRRGQGRHSPRPHEGLRGKSQRHVRALEGPHGGAGGRADQQGCPHVGRHGLHEVRGRRVLLGVVLVEDPARPARRPEGPAGGLLVGRALRLDAGPPHGKDRSPHDEAQQVRCRSQGDVACGVGGAAAREVPRAGGPAAEGPARAAVHRDLDERRPGRHTHAGLGEAPGPHAEGDRGRGRLRRAHGRRGRPDLGLDPREDHGHLDLRHAGFACPAGGQKDDRRHLRPGRRLHHPRA